MKKAKVQIDEEQAEDSEVNNGNYMTLVDNFVQGVIERAKQEYLGSCANGGVETLVREMKEDRLHTGNLLRCFKYLSSISVKNCQRFSVEDSNEIG